MSDQPLYGMQPLTRFSDRAAEYAKYRPGYPAEAIAALIEGLGDPTTLVAADIGAGTGISARLLADFGMQVWAIEPNESMRRAAAPHSRVLFQAGTAEQTGLSTATVNLVTCFQAFHWFDPAHCLPEFRRVLKPTGRLALVWNNRDRTDALTAGYSEVVQTASNHHPAGERIAIAEPLRHSPAFKIVRELNFSYRQPLDLVGLIGRAQSTSYVPKDNSVAQDMLLAGMTALYHQWADAQGLVYLLHNTQVILAEPVE